MKKSLLALLIALVLCLAVLLTGCGSKDGEGESGIKTGDEIQPLTITLHSITNDSTTPEQISAVEEAFNVITQAKYNTNVVLKLHKASEYESVVSELVKKNHELKESNSLVYESTDGLAVGEYPKERENQLDIFLVTSFDSFYELAKNEQIAAIDDDLGNVAVQLNSYVYPYNLKGAKYMGETYGVFNNTVYGGYKYLLLNKELVDAEMYDPEKMNSIDTISSFLRDVKTKHPDVIPFLGDLEAPIVSWSGEESLVGSFLGTDLISTGPIDASKHKPTSRPVGSLLENDEFILWAEKYNILYNAGCIVEKTDANKDSKFAATIIEGDVTLSPSYAEIYKKYKTDENGLKYTTIDGVDYYVSVYRRPMATNENVFNAGYVISSATENVSRCMEILTALNTDSELANLFMYGIKDVHYSIGEESTVVTKLTDSYSMNIEYAGNIYLLYQSTDMNDYWKFMSDNDWQNAKNTNREAIMSPLLGFKFEPANWTEMDVDDLNMQIDMENEANGTTKPYYIYTDLSYEDSLRVLKENTSLDYRALLTHPHTREYLFSTRLKEMQEAYTITGSEEYISDATKAVFSMSSPTGVFCISEQYNIWYTETYGNTSSEK